MVVGDDDWMSQDGRDWRQWSLGGRPPAKEPQKKEELIRTQQSTDESRKTGSESESGSGEPDAAPTEGSLGWDDIYEYLSPHTRDN